MALFPKSVPLDSHAILKLVRLYQTAYDDIQNEIIGATAFGAANRREILAQIDLILLTLNKDSGELLAEILPKLYQKGATEGVEQLKFIGANIEIRKGFNKIHQEAIQSLVDGTSRAFGESIQGIARNARNLMAEATKDVITQQLATGQISGEALKKIQKTIVGTLKTEGLDSLIDKGGHGWTLDRYAEMLIRTKAVEARNLGLKNRLVENGYDLVQVSSHGATDVCGDWEGKILSITGETSKLDGEDVPTVQEAENDGLFHPNCRHAINALNISLARETMGWNPDEQEYTKGLLKD